MEPGTVLCHSHSVIDFYYNNARVIPRVGYHGRDSDVADGAVNVICAEGWLAHADPDLIFIHFGEVDTAGHAHTYDAPEYRKAIEDIDVHIGKLTQAIAARKSIVSEDWLTILSSDHGGPSNANSHGDNGDVEIRTIPLIISGPSTAKGADLGLASLYNVVPTVLTHLGVPYDTSRFLAGPVGLSTQSQ